MQTHPNMVLLAEEVRAKRWSLHDIVREISDVIQARSEKNKNFGTIVVSWERGKGGGGKGVRKPKLWKRRTIERRSWADRERGGGGQGGAERSETL